VKKFFIAVSFSFFSSLLYATEIQQEWPGRINDSFGPIVEIISSVLFWDPLLAMGIDIGARVPLVVIWLFLAGMYFTIEWALSISGDSGMQLVL
jgi:hypothetical protein